MKKIILLIALFYSLTFSQQWNDLKQTTIQQISLPIKMDVFTNSSGNHILIEASNGNIIYYNVNSSGIVDVAKTETIESNGDFPTITGSSDKVYIFYKIGTNIKMKYSTDGGGNWIYNANLDRQINSSVCNGIDAFYELGNGVHLVWATKDNGSDYETYYYRLNTNVTPFQWVESKNVTDVSNYQYGGNPSVAVSTNRVHVSWNTNNGHFPLQGNANLRDKDNGVWQNPQPVVTGSEESGYERLIVQGSTLYMFYTQFDFGSGENRWDMDFRTRSISGTVWSASTEITTAIALVPNSFNVVKSFDNVIHLACLKASDVLIYYNSNSWNSFYVINSNADPGMPTGLTNVSNDLFSFSWKPYDYGRYLMLRQYDAAPLAPTNFAGTTYNNHPKLTWTLNSEPDIAGYEIWRMILGFGSYSLLTTVNSITNSFIDNGVELGGTIEGQVFYKIRAKDSHLPNPYYSLYTDFVKYNYSGLNKISLGTGHESFELSGNYPNPFNPSTVISYSIPFEGSVRLRVFNMLGEIVSELVNQTQSQGKYEAVFDASNLASGMFFYSIEVISIDGSQNLKEVKKMLLEK